MEVLRIITIYCCKVPGLQHFAWMHECGIYEVLYFFANIPKCRGVNMLDSDLVILELS